MEPNYGSIYSDFNPRSPRGERPLTSWHCVRRLAFQSTLPAWGATLSRMKQAQQQILQSTLPARGATPSFFLFRYSISHFNPRSPRGERPSEHTDEYKQLMISIHAPREGSDGKDAQ